MLITKDKTLKLSDYGFASFIFDKKSKKFKLSGTTCGSPGYMAPEVVNAEGGLKYDATKSDMWSLGVVLFEILVGTLPFGVADNEKQFLIDAKQKSWKMIPGYKSISVNAKNLLDKLLEFDPKNRPSAEEVLQDAWLAKTKQSIN